MREASILDLIEKYLAFSLENVVLLHVYCFLLKINDPKSKREAIASFMS